MADYFDRNQFTDEMDTVLLTQNQKDILLNKMRESDANPNNSPQKTKSNYGIWIKSVAAALVAVLTIGGIFVYTNWFGSKNSFAVVASAAELPESEQSDVLVGAFSNNGHSEFAMYDFDNYDEETNSYGHLLNEQGKIDYFDFFDLTELNITGKNIESVTLAANKKFTYFSLEPLKQPEKSQDQICQMFSDYDSINNSQYAKGEGEGFFAETGRCDSFTFKNPDVTDEEQIISLGNYFCLVIESDRTDEDIDEAVEKIEEFHSAYKTVLDTNEQVARLVKVSEKTDEELMNELRKNLGIMDRKSLDGATIDVTVKFTDGSTQTKVLDIDFYQKVEDGVYYSPKIVLSYSD